MDLIEKYINGYIRGKIDLISDIVKLLKSRKINSYEDYVYVTSGIIYCSNQLYNLSEILESSYMLEDEDYLAYRIFTLEEELKLIEVS